MEKRSEYHKLDLLKGYKKVILGNHDLCRPSHTQELLKYVSAVGGAITDKKKGYILTHVPVHPQELNWGFQINIHGHVHTNSVDDPRYINVCMEAVDYTPVLLKNILEKHVK